MLHEAMEPKAKCKGRGRTLNLASVTFGKKRRPKGKLRNMISTPAELQTISVWLRAVQESNASGILHDGDIFPFPDGRTVFIDFADGEFWAFVYPPPCEGWDPSPVELGPTACSKDMAWLILNNYLSLLN